MELIFDAASMQQFIDELPHVRDACRLCQDEPGELYSSAMQRYSRSQAEAESALHSASLQVDYARSAMEQAREEYNAAVSQASDSEDEGGSAAVRQAQQRLAEASNELRLSEAKLSRCQQRCDALTALWAEHSEAMEASRREVEDGFLTVSTLTGSMASTLSEYMQRMVLARSTYLGTEGGASSAPTGSGGSEGSSNSVRFAGWCEKNDFSAVHGGKSGEKTVDITIGGETKSYPCTKSGIARAYRAAVRSGDSDMIERTNAMYEIETLREDLELGSGSADYPQLGGYHRNVQTQDPAGFESHHIPSRSVQDADAGWLPTVSISEEDHKLTSSYSGKQRHVFEPMFPSSVPPTTYKESITRNLEKGGSGYIDSVRSELLDLRVTTGHRYDGGVSGYLDAVIDMLASRGLPGARRDD